MRYPCNLMGEPAGGWPFWRLTEPSPYARSILADAYRRRPSVLEMTPERSAPSSDRSRRARTRGLSLRQCRSESENIPHGSKPKPGVEENRRKRRSEACA
jgi:hypothetical protein